MCVDLTGQKVLLVASGPQIRDKEERLAPFGAALVTLPALSAEDLADRPAFVIIGDLPLAQAEAAAALCHALHVPVNVVDVPRLCSFTFPSLMVSGDVTVSVSTGGKTPSAAAHLRALLQQALPEHTGDIVAWLAGVRAALPDSLPLPRRAALMRQITQAAFNKGEILDDVQLQRLLDDAP
jgi:siroheme synthase (precorrin-2 oxidase/ferrochelatase)